MLRAANRRLRAQRGESLLESLAAAMIISLALMILAGALISAARVNRRASGRETVPSSEQGVLAAPLRQTSEWVGEKTARIAFGSSDILPSSDSGSSYSIAVYKNTIRNTTRGGDEYGGKAFYFYDLASSETGLGSSEPGS